ncbi:uncharacterized protein LOC128199916 isoform X3 [Bicyclus anynana]|uniref:Uncharacterized protein LOC128199916 isoform X3 n=1 Tax=Bicyclus anynana TaxID=110368 RepID=A0ABM3M8F8_BICAN|nr:uncharacterized protein LOC128199916 isoform X3 [Bicyclus anynana]
MTFIILTIIVNRAKLSSSTFKFWLSDHGLSLAVDKCQAVVFTRKRSIPTFNFSLEEQPINLIDKAKFLGIILDRKLNGIAHSQYISRKCEKGINVLRAVAGVWWGAHAYSLKLLYNALVRSHIDYCLFILDPLNKTTSELLNRIQYRSLRIVLGAMKSSPTNALQVECVDPPLHLRRQYLCDRFISKTLHLSSHPLWSKLTQLSVVLRPSNPSSCLLNSFEKFTNLPHPLSSLSINPLYSTSYEALVYNPPVITDLGLTKDAPDTNTKFQEIVHQNWSNYLFIYTDASKLSPESCVGAACWVPKYKIVLQFKCPPETSVFTGEAVALLEAILFARSHNIKQTVIFTDSLSCLYSIRENPFRTWIPSHSGISGNESADSCAKAAVQLGSLEHFKNYSHDLSTLAKNYLDKSWQSFWNQSKTIKEM